MNGETDARSRFAVRSVCSVVFAVLVLVAFAPSWFGDRLFFPLHTRQMEPWRSSSDPAVVAELDAHDSPVTTDKNFLFHPDTAWMVECWKRGELPRWNPWILGGVSQIGQALLGCYYPPNLLYLVVPPERAYAWLAALHVCIAGAGAYRLLRRLGRSRGAATLGAVAFAFAAPLSLRFHYFMTFYPAAWLPWLFLAVLRFVDRPGLARALGIPLPIAAIVLTGFPQTGVYGVHAALALGLVLLLRRRGRRALRPALGLGAATALALPLVAAQVLPVLAVQKISESRDRSAQQQVERAGSPTLPLGLLFPSPFFDPDEPLTQDWTTNPLWAAFYCRVDPPAAEGELPVPRLLPRPNPTEDAAYPGMVVLFLALVAVFGGRGRDRRTALVAAGGTVLCFAYAMGLEPLVSTAYRFVPGANMGDVRRILPTAALFLAVLAATGLDVLFTAVRTRRQALAVLGMGLSVVLVCLAIRSALSVSDAAAMHATLAERIEERTGRVLPYEERSALATQALLDGQLDRSTGAALAAAAALLAALALRRRALLAALLPTVVLATDLVLVHREHNPFVPAEGFLEPHPLLEKIAGELDGSRVHRFVLASQPLDPLRSVVLPPNLGSHFGIADAEGYIVAVPSRYAAFHRAMWPKPDVAQTVLVSPLTATAEEAPAALENPLLDIASIRFLLTTVDLHALGVDPQHWALEAVDGVSRVYRNTRCRPFAIVFPEATEIPQTDDPGRWAEHLAEMSRPGSDPTVLRVEVYERSVGSRRLERPSRVRSCEWRGQDLHLELEDGEGGFLFVAEGFVGQRFDADWSCEVDGVRRNVRAADIAFCSVWLPPGAKVVELRYRPRAAVWGLWVSGAAIALLLIFAWTSSRGPEPKHAR